MWYYEHNDKVIVEQTSPFSDRHYQMEINMPYDKFVYALNEWREGELIQNAFPNLTADEREFLLTGITPTEWEQLFGDEQ